MRSRTATPEGDGPDPGGTDSDRRVRLGLTFRGAGRLEGELTPACAAALSAVLEALGKKPGPEDARTPVQRHHDALEEACRRLAGAGFSPDRAGQPTHVQLHLTLDQLRGQPGAREAEAAWRAGQAAGDGQPGWLSARAAQAYGCDAAITPAVTGHLDPAALDALAGAFLARHPGPCPLHDPGRSGDGPGQPGCGPGHPLSSPGPSGSGPGHPGTSPAHRGDSRGQDGRRAAEGHASAGAGTGQACGPLPGRCQCTSPPLPPAAAARLRNTLLAHAAACCPGPPGWPHSCAPA